MKTKNQIAVAHDILCGVLRGDVPGMRFKNKLERGRIEQVAATLQWVLDYSSDSGFEQMISSLVEQARCQGFEIVPVKTDHLSE